MGILIQTLTLHKHLMQKYACVGGYFNLLGRIVTHPKQLVNPFLSHDPWVKNPAPTRDKMALVSFHLNPTGT
jgi:hypothetical protein